MTDMAITAKATIRKSNGLRAVQGKIGAIILIDEFI